MLITSYQSTGDFLTRTREELERQEVKNSLPLGIVLGMYQHPERVKIAPYLASIEDEHGLVMIGVMTPPNYLIVTSNRSGDLREAEELLIRNLRENNWNVPGMRGPAPVSDNFAQTWTDLTGQGHHIRTSQRIFELTSVIPPRPGPGELRLAKPDDLELIVSWFRAFSEEVDHDPISPAETLEWARNRMSGTYFWVLPDGEVVSMACKTRPVSKVVSVGPVYTPPEHRGHGYASRCVAALSQILLDSGWERCSLFTDRANPTSNKIYQHIGYNPVCDFNDYRFG